ncbi:AMP-binding enzyme [Polychaeton citri CBS 116435]|uniref:AMP-binding enzyme n=1 Tax=Polychaeton citri CBS 116435 TaxID=1314669 RepID=A0A9P4Q297_9PEZI|nr:AMP-binding enzyme [Polychaeton citri CBS 116435]
MPFLAEETYPIPTKDIASWTFDEISYDWDKPIYIEAQNPKNFITARRAKELIRQLVAGFHALPSGLNKGDVISIHSFNDIHYPIFFHGIAAAGGCFAGTNPAYTPGELCHTLKSARVKYVLVQPALLEAMEKACQQAGLPRDRIIIFNPNGEPCPPGYLQWSDLLSHGEKDWIRFNDLETAKNTTAALLFSSGTTGLPKAAILSHYNFVAQQTLVYDTQDRPWTPIRLYALPMFHAAMTPSACCGPLREGGEGYVLPRFDPEAWFWANERYKVTDIAFVPATAIMTVNSPLRYKYSLKSARVAFCGAAPMDKMLQARVQDLMGEGATITQVWGMTETSCICTRFKYPEYDDTGSVGRALVGIDLKLVDDNGRDITDYDIRGELCVRGPTVVRGYFENEEANSRDWDEDGYFHTGDIAFRNRVTKLWYIVDRKKELIKVRANQVAPAELEGVLLTHPDIADAAVIGVPNPESKRYEGDELPRAYIIRRPGEGGKLTETDVHEFTKDKLASFKRLCGGIVFTDAIPKNQSGKILKRTLREQAKKEMAVGSARL